MVTGASGDPLDFPENATGGDGGVPGVAGGVEKLESPEPLTHPRVMKMEAIITATMVKARNGPWRNDQLASTFLFPGNEFTKCLPYQFYFSIETKKL